MSDEIKQQLNFVEWLKDQGIYNPMESAHTMRRMFNVYKSRDPELKELTEKLWDSDQLVDMLNHETEVLEADCKNLVEINNNQSENMNAWEKEIADLVAENKKLRGALVKMYDMYAGRLDDLSLRLMRGEADLIYGIYPFVKQALKDGE